MQLLSSWPYTALYINIILCLHLLVYSLKTYTMTTLPSPSLLFILPNLKFSKTRAQCVNGLLCIHPKCTVKFSSRVNAFTLVANPTTRQVITLPLDQSIDKDFCKSTHFGYNSDQDEFKVLGMVMYQGGSHHEVKVFIVTLHGGLFLLKDTML